MTHLAFATSARRLKRDSPAMRLFEKAKQFGVWNPGEIDLRQDARDWQTLSLDEREILLHLTSLFQAGEEAVTLDLLPLLASVAREGRLEDEMYLTTFLWEEAKHIDFFDRSLREVMGAPGDLTRFHSTSYRQLFYQALPEAMARLWNDSSAAAQIRAAVTYNMVAEGVLAETGYHAYYTVLQRNGLMPGQLEGITHVKQDESRHIAYGLHLIARLIAADDNLWQVAEDQMNELLPTALAIVGDVFECYDPVPFGLEIADFTDYAVGQFEKRMAWLERARGASLDEVNRATAAVLEA
jgi:ribonucleoside-diphosphate reductase beta chain